MQIYKYAQIQKYPKLEMKSEAWQVPVAAPKSSLNAAVSCASSCSHSLAVYKYTNTQIYKYINTQIHKYSSIQIHKYQELTGHRPPTLVETNKKFAADVHKTQIDIYTSTQISKYKNLHIQIAPVHCPVQSANMLVL